jgi:hypothetical protein
VQRSRRSRMSHFAKSPMQSTSVPVLPGPPLQKIIFEIICIFPRCDAPIPRLMSVAVAVRQSRRNNDAVSWSEIFHDRNLLGFETVGQQMEMRGRRCRAAERVSLGERNHDFCGGTKIKKSNLI